MKTDRRGTQGQLIERIQIQTFQVNIFDVLQSVWLSNIICKEKTNNFSNEIRCLGKYSPGDLQHQL